MEQTDFSASDSLKTWGVLVVLLLVGVLAVALGLALWLIFGAAYDVERGALPAPAR